MRNVTVAAVQMKCSTDVNENIKKAEDMVREAAGKGANIILLPELFERQYFCQERRYEYYDFAQPVEENNAVNHFKNVAKELGVVIPVSFYERDINVLYNSVAASILQELFQDRKVYKIPARPIIVGGGNIHCITQQIPE